MTGNSFQPVTKSLVFSFLIVLVGCAEVQPPPGGDEDRIPPTVIHSQPENGAINVEPSNKIIFWFSEGITRPASGKPVFITPRQSTASKLSWKSDRLEIELAEQFKPNQTYVVTLTSDITDWRRNKMDSTATMAFSTGEKIDTGSVSGTVTANGENKGGILVGLYSLPVGSETIKYDSVFPDYLSQTSADGTFRFRFLPDKGFQLVAFDDIIRNERYNPKEEAFAVSDRIITVGGQQPLDNLYLDLKEPADFDVRIVSAILTADRLLKVRTNAAIAVKYLNQNLNLVKVFKAGNESQQLDIRALLESHEELSSVFTFATSKIDTGKYTIELPFASDKEPLKFDGAVIPKIEDKSAPLPIAVKPENKAHFLKKVEMGLVFSEPIDRTKLTDETFVLTNAQDEALGLSSDWDDAFHISFKTDGLKEGGKYKLTLAEFEIADLAGNVMGDSIQTFEFSVLDSDSLGSVNGSVKVRIPDKLETTKQLKFEEINGKQTVDLIVTGNSFTAILPAGKYLLSGYLDENNNGRRDGGGVDPYTFAETYTKFSDTISVRARFETAGIEITFK